MSVMARWRRRRESATAERVTAEITRHADRCGDNAKESARFCRRLVDDIARRPRQDETASRLTSINARPTASRLRCCRRAARFVPRVRVVGLGFLSAREKLTCPEALQESGVETRTSYVAHRALRRRTSPSRTPRPRRRSTSSDGRSKHRTASSRRGSTPYARVCSSPALIASRIRSSS